MLHCSDQYEVYDTTELVEQASGIPNYGSYSKVSGVRKSLSKNDTQSITFIEGLAVRRLYRDYTLRPEDQVVVETIIQLDLEDDEFTRDAFVLDSMIAVRVNDAEFQFF